MPEFKRILPEEEFRLLFRRSDPPSEPQVRSRDRISGRRFTFSRRRACRKGRRRSPRPSSPRKSERGFSSSARSLLEASMFPLLRLGAKGMLTYAEVPTQLVRALRTIASGGFWVPRSLLSRFVEATLSATRRSRPLLASSIRSLSRREKEVLELLLQNLSNKEIAKELHISARTAKFHVSNLLAKHGVRRRADLILLNHARSEGRDRTSGKREAGCAGTVPSGRVWTAVPFRNMRPVVFVPGEPLQWDGP